MFWLFSKRRSVDSSKIVLTEEFRSMLSLFENSNNNFFLTGNAGTGKTTLLKQFREQTKKNVILLAPTGIAAFNLGGQTIHSFFQFPPRIITPKVISKIHTNSRIYKVVDTIVIDEVSMVRADLLDGIDIFMRRYGRDRNQPFGGAQIILAGDPYQLPPVVTSAEEPIISKFYKTPYFFSAKIYNRANFQPLELTEIHRQHDEKFIKLLNLIRHGKVGAQNLKPINDNLTEFYYTNPEHQGVTLSTTNKVADTINQTYLLKLSGPEYKFQAEIIGKFPENKDVTVPRNLLLRKGAHVMILKNTGKFKNGDTGIVTRLDQKNIIIKLDSNGEEFVVLREKWENIRYRVAPHSNDIKVEVIGKLRQFPLRLAWAITVHKSQGMTFDRVNIDFSRSPFVGGQTYVALSRCRTIEGITVTKKLYPNDIFVDNRVVDFMRNLENAQSTKNIKIKSVANSYSSETEPKIITISRIKDADLCPFKYFKNYIEKPHIEAPFISIELGLGQYFHNCLDKKFKIIKSQNRLINENDSLDVKRILDNFRMIFLWENKIRKPYKIIQRDKSFGDFYWRLETIIKNFNSYVMPKLYKHKVEGSEGPLQIRTNKYLIRGKYDLLTKDRDDVFYLWDWKTGEEPKREYFNEFLLQKIQLGIYSIWIHHKFDNKETISSAVFLKNRPSVLTERFNRDLEDKILEFLFDKREEINQLENYNPVRNNLCQWCSWKYDCPIMKKFNSGKFG